MPQKNEDSKRRGPKSVEATNGYPGHQQCAAHSDAGIQAKRQKPKPSSRPKPGGRIKERLATIGAMLDGVVQVPKRRVAHLFPGEYLVHPRLFMRGPENAGARSDSTEQQSKTISPAAIFCAGRLSSLLPASLKELT